MDDRQRYRLLHKKNGEYVLQFYIWEPTGSFDNVKWVGRWIDMETVEEVKDEHKKNAG